MPKDWTQSEIDDYNTPYEVRKNERYYNQGNIFDTKYEDKYNPFYDSGVNQLRTLGINLPNDKSNKDLFYLRNGKQLTNSDLVGSNELNLGGFRKNEDGTYSPEITLGSAREGREKRVLDFKITPNEKLNNWSLVQAHDVGDMIKFAKDNGITDPSKLFSYDPDLGIVANKKFSDIFYLDKTTTKPGKGNWYAEQVMKAVMMFFGGVAGNAAGAAGNMGGSIAGTSGLSSVTSSGIANGLVQGGITGGLGAAKTGNMGNLPKGILMGGVTGGLGSGLSNSPYGKNITDVLKLIEVAKLIQPLVGNKSNNKPLLKRSG